MEDQRKNELAVIIAETVAFGFLSRLLVRIPYMAFGDFSSGFFISATLWWIYNSLLFYVTYSMRYDGTNMATDQFAITYALASGCILLCTILEYDYIYNERTSRFVNLQIAFFFFMINLLSTGLIFLLCPSAFL